MKKKKMLMLDRLRVWMLEKRLSAKYINRISTAYVRLAREGLE